MKSWKLGLAILVVLIALAVAPATAQTFDNSGGGSWKEYMSFPITTTPTEYAQYKIVINGTTWELYNVTGALEASGTNNNFWSLVNLTGADIRVFDQNYNQMYFWVEEWDYANQRAVIWVNVTANSSELNIAYGNPSALTSRYMNGSGAFEFYDDFNLITGYTTFTDGYYSSADAKPEAHPATCYDPLYNYTYVLLFTNAGTYAVAKLDSQGNTVEYVDTGITPVGDYEHAGGWILTDKDGYILLFFGKHGGTGYPRVFRSTAPAKLEFELAHEFTDLDFCYPRAILLPNGDILLFARNNYGTATSLDEDIIMLKSSDGGYTWTATRLTDYSGESMYFSEPYLDSNGRLHFVATPDNPKGTHLGVIYMYSDDYGQTWHKADGTELTLPVDDSQFDWVIQETGSASIWNGITVYDGKPVILLHRGRDTGTRTLSVAIWNGTSWEIHDITTMDDSKWSGESGYIRNENGVLYVYAQLDINGTYELKRFKSEDGGITWVEDQFITENLEYDAFKFSESANLLSEFSEKPPIESVFSYGTSGDVRVVLYPQMKFLEKPQYALDTNRWDILETNANCIQEVKDGRLWLEVAGGNTWTWSGVVSKKTFDVSRIIVEVRVMEKDADVYDTFPAVSPDDTTANTDNVADWLAIIGRSSTSSDILHEKVGGTETTLYDFGSYISPQEWHIAKLIRNGNQVRAIIDDKDSGWLTTSVTFTTAYIRLHIWTDNQKGGVYYDWIRVFKLADPANFGTPVVKLFQKKFGTKTVYVNVTYLDTAVTERYNPTAYYKLEDKPQINVTSMLFVSGVNATYGANISIELIDFVTLDKVVYNGTEVSVTYQGTVTNSTTGYVYNVYSFTTYEDGTLEIYGHVGNKAYEATFKLDGKTVDVFNVTAVVGEPLEILLPHAGNVTIASAEYTGVTSVSVNTKDLGTGAKSLTITIEDPENFAVGYRYGTVNIDWGKVYFNVTDLQNKTLARTTYGFFNKNFSILSTDPTKLYAGDIEIDVYFHGVKLKSLEIHLNHTNNGLTLNVSVNATQFKDYRNITRIIASPNYFEAENLSTKYPFSVMKLINVSGTVVIDYVSSPPTSVKVEGATSYTYEKPVLKITASGNVTITDLYKLSTPLKDRLGNPVNFYVLINGSRVDASKGVASKLLKPSWYEVEVPITVSGFELWKFNDSSNIALVEINTSDKTLPTAEYRVPTKIETKEVRIQRSSWLPFPFPFLSENKPAQEETPIVRLEGTLRDFYNAPIANRTIKIEVASPNFTRIYNVTTDSSGNFKIDVDMARGVEYKVTYKFAGDDVYVGTSTTKTFTIEQLLPAPPEEMTITELLIFVGIAVGLVAVVAGAIYLAKRTKAKTLARMESEFRFFRRLK